MEFTLDWKLGTSVKYVLNINNIFYLIFNQLDASRRDLTINAMFLDIDGVLYDYFNGADDLSHKRIRFVGDANDRIREDYLRILRYFRFFARYGGVHHDQETLSAMKTHANGLKGISGERIWSEMKRILPLKNSVLVVPVMLNEVRLAAHLGLADEQIDTSEFRLAHSRLFNNNESIEPITLFSALLKDENDISRCAKRIRLSNTEKFIAYFILLNRECSSTSISDLRKKIALSPSSDQKLMQLYVIEYLKYVGRGDDVDLIRQWKVPHFPLRGEIVGQRLAKKNNIKHVIDDLRIMWAESGYQMDVDELISKIDTVVDNRGFQFKKEYTPVL